MRFKLNIAFEPVLTEKIRSVKGARLKSSEKETPG